MKKSVIFVFCITLVLGLYAGHSKNKDEADAVRSVLESYVQAWNSLDADQYMSNFVRDVNLLIFNSNPAVTYQGWEKMNELVHQAFQANRDPEIKFRDVRIQVSDSGDLAWLACYLDGHFTSGDKVNTMTGIRTTWILEKRDGLWRIVHSHWSLPEKDK